MRVLSFELKRRDLGVGLGVREGIFYYSFLLTPGFCPLPSALRLPNFNPQRIAFLAGVVPRLPVHAYRPSSQAWLLLVCKQI